MEGRRRGRGETRAFGSCPTFSNVVKTPRLPPPLPPGGPSPAAASERAPAAWGAGPAGEGRRGARRGPEGGGGGVGERSEDGDDHDLIETDAWPRPPSENARLRTKSPQRDLGRRRRRGDDGPSDRRPSPRRPRLRYKKGLHL